MGASKRQTVDVVVNGRRYQREIEARLTLADFLRDELDLTGTHLGCEQGICGACTILLDGVPVRSCLLFAVQVNGCEIRTVEALASESGLHPLQEALGLHHGLQCGFCTPGILMTCVDLLARHPSPTDQQIRSGLGGNLCRCTGYQSIVTAVKAAAAKMNQTGQEGDSWGQ